MTTSDNKPTPSATHPVVAHLQRHKHKYLATVVAVIVAVLVGFLAGATTDHYVFHPTAPAQAVPAPQRAAAQAAAPPAAVKTKAAAQKAGVNLNTGIDEKTSAGKHYAHELEQSFKNWELPHAVDPITFPDISNNNPLSAAQLAAVKAAGHPAIYLKAVQANWQDPTFATMAREAKSAGLIVGGYDFVEDYNVSEAQSFVAALTSAGLCGASAHDVLPPALDIEAYTASQTGVQAMVNYIKAACGRVIVYTGGWFWNGHLGQSWWPTGVLGAWYAGYPNLVDEPTGTAWLHQYSDVAFNGATDADMSEFLGDAAQWNTFINAASPAETAAAQKAATAARKAATAKAKAAAREAAAAKKAAAVAVAKLAAETRQLAAQRKTRDAYNTKINHALADRRADEHKTAKENRLLATLLKEKTRAGKLKHPDAVYVDRKRVAAVKASQAKLQKVLNGYYAKRGVVQRAINKLKSEIK